MAEMSAAEYLWIWLNVCVYLTGAVTIAYYGIDFFLTALKQRKKDSEELKTSAERESQRQEETANVRRMPR